MTRRRDFLAIAAGAVAARTVLPMVARAEKLCQDETVSTAHPDAALMAACDAFLTHWAAMPVAVGPAREWGTPESYRQEAAIESHVERGEELVAPVVGLAATTLAGLQAKARVLIEWDGGNWIRPEGELSSQLLASLTTDLLDEGVTAWGGRPIHAKTYASVLHAISWAGQMQP